MHRALDDTLVLPGRGLFTGRPVTLRLEPAPGSSPHALHVAAAEGAPVALADAAIDPEPIHPVFARVPARSTNLRLPGGARLATLEHVLSALVGAGVFGATVRLIPEAPPGECLDGAAIEAPIFDGSARDVADALRAARTVPIDITPITPTGPVVVHADESDPASPSVRIDPPGPRQARAVYRYRLRYPNEDALHASLHAGTAEWTGDCETYLGAVAPARTFALEQEAAALRAAGLGAHLTPRDALVIAPDGPIDNTLRFLDEPARHKLLDLIGDLALAGRPVLGTVTADRAGHALNHRAALTLRNLG